MKSNMSDHEMVFHKIMVAIDGSEQSFKAVEYALDIAINQQKKDIQFLVVSVVELVKLNLSTFIAAPTYRLKDLQERREEARNWINKIEKIIKDRDRSFEFKAQILENPTLKKFSNNRFCRSRKGEFNSSRG